MMRRVADGIQLQGYDEQKVVEVVAEKVEETVPKIEKKQSYEESLTVFKMQCDPLPVVEEKKKKCLIF